MADCSQLTVSRHGNGHLQELGSQSGETLGRTPWVRPSWQVGIGDGDATAHSDRRLAAHGSATGAPWWSGAGRAPECAEPMSEGV